MSDRYREVLTQLRCEANLMRDCSFLAVRHVAIRMVQMIDVELSAERPATPIPTVTDPTSIPSAELLREISRRMREIRHVPKLCSRCQRNPTRARGLCMRCYKKAYRRGEIDNAGR